MYLRTRDSDFAPASCSQHPSRTWVAFGACHSYVSTRPHETYSRSRSAGSHVLPVRMRPFPALLPSLKALRHMSVLPGLVDDPRHRKCGTRISKKRYIPMVWSCVLRCDVCAPEDEQHTS